MRRTNYNIWKYRIISRAETLRCRVVARYTDKNTMFYLLPDEKIFGQHQGHALRGTRYYERKLSKK